MDKRQDLLESSLRTLEINAVANKIILFEDENYTALVRDFRERALKLLSNQLSVVCYVWKENLRAQLEIIPSGYLRITSCKPYCVRKGFGSDIEEVDIAPYIKILLQLCEQIPLYEMNVERIDPS